VPEIGPSSAAATSGHVVFHDSRNSLARSDDTILTAVVDVDVVVVVKRLPTPCW